jgi:hypothetical protein
MTSPRTPAPRITLRPAVRQDAPAIGAVFDAAVRAGWTYLGDLAAGPLFTPQDWDHLVAGHLPPDVLLAAVDETGGLVGYTAARSSRCTAAMSRESGIVPLLRPTDRTNRHRPSCAGIPYGRDESVSLAGYAVAFQSGRRPR